MIPPTTHAGLGQRAMAAAAGLCLVLGALACAPKPHAYSAEPMAGNWRIAILPLANYSANRDATDRVLPILAVELAQKPGVTIVDQGEVDAALAKEPWIALDRIPPDLIESLGASLKANAIMIGSVMSYTARDYEAEKIPQVSLSLRLVEAPGGRVLWNAVHSRDGGDSESVFGLGRVQTAEQLVTATLREMLETFPTGQETGK
jgi:hypothetical protein